MRHTTECCCGSSATFDTSGDDSCYIAGQVRAAYETWMAQHDGCPALYASQPLQGDGTGVSLPPLAAIERTWRSGDREDPKPVGPPLQEVREGRIP